MSGLPKKGEVTPDAPKVLSRLDLDPGAWFLAREDGLWFFERKIKDGAPVEIPTRLTYLPFEVVGLLQPIDGDNQRGLLARLPSGREVSVPFASVSKEADVVAWLLDHGVSCDTRRKGQLLLYFATARAKTVRAYIRGFTVSLLLIDEAAFCDEESLIAVLPMVTDGGRTIFASTPAGRQGMFASLFLDPKPGVERIVVRGTDIPRLADRVERLRIALPPTKFRQEVEVEMLGGGENYFDIAAIEKAVSPMEALCL